MIDSSNYQNQFIVKAQNQGWPQDVLDQVRVELNESKFDVEYPPELEDTVFDLEYGKFETPPTGVIRNFKARVGKEAADKVSTKLVKDATKGSVFD